MKSKVLITAAVLLAAGLALHGQSITVTSPTAADEWCIGGSYTITWTKSGAMANTVTVRLRRPSSGAGGADTVVIESRTDNDGEVRWTIPDTVTPGEYSIRVRTLEDEPVTGDSPDFQIAACPRDLELKSVEYAWPTLGLAGSGFGAWVVSHFTAIDQDVSFQFVFPDMPRSSSQTISKRLILRAEEEAPVYLLAMHPDDIPLRGLRIQVTIDGPVSQIAETNEINNRIAARIGILDLQCSVRRDELTLQKISGHSREDFRVQFKIRVRHNLYRTVPDVHVRWTLSGPGGEIKNYSHTIESLGAGVEHVWNVNETFGKVGRERSKHPRLREGTPYRIVAAIVDPGDEFFDVSPENDASRFTFSFPE